MVPWKRQAVMPGPHFRRVDRLTLFASCADTDDGPSRYRLGGSRPGAGTEYRQAKAHADAMRSHRAHVVATIAELEQRQDELLDQLGTSPA